MNLCHIVPSIEEKHGGPSKSVLALCRGLAEAGSSVDLLATDPHAPASGSTSAEGARLRLRLFHRDWPRRLCRSQGLAAAACEAKAEVYHHHSIWLRTLHYAHEAARRTGAPLVVSPRGMLNHWAWHHHALRKRIAMRCIHPGAFEAVAGWHATSDDEAQEIRSRGFTQPICIAPNGVVTPNPADRDSAQAHWLSACPEIQGRRVALFYSRFHSKKRVVELIDLWLEVAPAGWLLLLVGIPEEYSPELLQRYIDNAGGGGRVSVFSGLGSPPPYAVASLFLLPSHCENFGLSIAEAMAHGVPVVVTDATPWSGINVEQRGWCVPWTEYAAALRAALSEPRSSLGDRGARARDWVLQEFSWTRSAERLQEFYQELVAKRS